MRLASRYKSINPISHNENTFAHRNEFHLAVEDKAQILTWSLSKDIGNLIFGVDEVQFDMTLLNVVFDEMISNVDVLCHGMVHGIVRNGNSAASAVEVDTHDCFFEVQLTSLPPRNWQEPDVLFLSSLHPPSSESVKALS
ncbi:hypothetical protein L2E82_44708 [Cichorium intybus]|uniref:Uncharacterized protein n=1 Tax=Cichorium intybus TaxID=13427 RepID=A0ACB8ZRB7_CICIN|nr:hypothetical protein L2E82_44708 [Cichorium intybus]